MTAGDVVWIGIGASWLVWLALTLAVRGLPSIAAVVRAFLRSWTGRAIALAAWGGAGWHLFCQRP